MNYFLECIFIYSHFLPSDGKITPAACKIDKSMYMTHREKRANPLPHLIFGSPPSSPPRQYLLDSKITKQTAATQRKTVTEKERSPDG